MNNLLIKLYAKYQELASREEGQDLIEYALLAAIIALGAVTTMGTLSNAISTAFSNIAGKVSGNGSGA